VLDDLFPGGVAIPAHTGGEVEWSQMQRSSMMFGLGQDALELIHSTHANLHATNKVIPIEPLSREQIAQLFESAFWASLMTNEGRPTKVRFGVVVGTGTASLVLATPLPLDEKSIVALAPAVPHDGWIAVSVSDGTPMIVGIEIERSLGILSGVTSFDICGQGVVQIGFGEWEPFAVLSGRTLAITAAGPAAIAMYLVKVLRSTISGLGHYALQAAFRRHTALVDLARMIVNEGHGGALLLVPEDDASWEASLNPYPYRLEKANATVRDEIEAGVAHMKDLSLSLTALHGSSLSDETKETIRAGIQWSTSKAGALAKVARLAQVDGAVVLAPNLQVLGFGAKINVASTTKFAVVELEPRAGEDGEGTLSVPIDLEKLGGTRHQSAARFVAAHTRAVAIVASSDRRLSIMSWDIEREAVVVLRNAEWWR
jgi:hypothetical protein